MAARRLVILMVALLAASALAAALAPEPRERDEEQETTAEQTVAPPAAESERGHLVSATLDADAEKPGTVELERGDQLALTVRSVLPGQVEIPALGLLDYVDPDAPARFDLLVEQVGRLEVRLVEPPRTIGTIAVGGQESEPEAGEGAQAASSRGVSSSSSDRP